MVVLFSDVHSKKCLRSLEAFCFKLNFHSGYEMPRLTTEQRWIAIIVMFQTGVTQADIAEHFGCSQPCISNLIHRYLTTVIVNDAPCSGRPRVTTPNQDRYIVLQH